MSDTRIEPGSELQFMLAGKSIFTILNPASGVRFTYKATKAESNPGLDPETYWVKLLNGPDNYSNYIYIGMIQKNQFRITKGSKVSADTKSVICLTWTFSRLVAGLSLNGVEILFEGRCGRCGKRLTVPESITRGFGPDCAGKL